MIDILIANYKTSELDEDDHLGWFKLVMDVSNIITRLYAVKSFIFTFFQIISAERYTNYGRLEAQWFVTAVSTFF